MSDTYNKSITPGFFDTKIGIKLFNSLIKNNIDSEVIEQIENDLSETSSFRNKKYDNEEHKTTDQYIDEMKQSLEEAGCPLSTIDIFMAHAAFIANNGLVINDNINISDKDKINMKDEFFDEIISLYKMMSIYKNLDHELIQNTFNSMFSHREPDQIERFIANVIANEPKTKIPTINITENFAIQKIEKGNCEARYVNGNKPCQNKTMPGKICCSEHQPLTQEDKKIIMENKLETTSSTKSEFAETESSNECNDHIHENEHDKCKYLGLYGKQCKNKKAYGKFCKKCHKIHTEESHAQKIEDYCIVIVTRGLNKGRACGKKSCGTGFHVCIDHRDKTTIKKCGHTDKNGKICNNNVNDPSLERCGQHINSISNVRYETEPEKKSEALLEWEEEQRQMANEKPQHCELLTEKGNVCSRRADGYVEVKNKETGKSVEKLACPMHAEINNKKNNESETHRCLAICAHGGQCKRMNVPDCDLYCLQHNEYDPEDRCGAFDEKTEDRCLKKCKKDKVFCCTHKNYTADPIQDQYDVDIIRGWIRIQEFYSFLNQYTVVCIDPPKKILKLNIISDEPNKSNKKQLAIKSMINNESYGLDYYASNSEDSDGTEESELEMVQPEVVVPKKVWSLIPDEFDLINKATGWTEEQIKIMKNKRIFKRILGPKKQFNLEKTLFESRKALEQHFVKYINEANGKYVGCKKQFENLIRATHFDLSASVENVISLFGAQRFFSREKMIDNCKDSLKVLRNIESLYDNRIKGLPVPIIKKQLVKMDIKKYTEAFEDVIHTFKKEYKEDRKYLKEFEKYAYGVPKKSKYPVNLEKERADKREEFNEKYRDYFEKYIVRFATVSLHKENCKGRMFGFANYFIDLLNKTPLDYSRFRNAYGGEIRNEDGEKVFYCDVFSIITKIIEDNNNKDDKEKIMSYFDIDISLNLSSSEHQTEFSEELRECKRTGKFKADCKSMLDVGIVERFRARDGCYDYDGPLVNVDTFCNNIVGFNGNFLDIMAKEKNYRDYDLAPDPAATTAPIIPFQMNMGNLIFREEIKDEFKQSYSNNVNEILGIDI
jgi:hypothetical protein